MGQASLVDQTKHAIMPFHAAPRMTTGSSKIPIDLSGMEASGCAAWNGMMACFV